MRILSLIGVLLSLSGAALGEEAISLPPMKGDKALDVVETKNVTGSCGTSMVRVMGVTTRVDSSYRIDQDAGKIIVRSGTGKELVLGLDNDVLSDHNGVACVLTKSGSRLLVWSQCAGSACGDRMSFFVIDPERLVFLAPKDPRKGRCDDKCASQLLGNRLPQKINSQ